MTLSRSAKLTLVCLAVMAAALPSSIGLFDAYTAPGTARGAAGIVREFAIPVLIVGMYVFVFLSANTAMSIRPMWPGVVLAAPAALLMSWAIIAGLIFGWFLFIYCLYGLVTLFVVFPISGSLSRDANSTLLIALLTLSAGAVGCKIGFLVHAAAAALSGQPLWDRAGRKTALADCAGFAIGAACFFLTYFLHGLRSPLMAPRATADAVELFRLFWPLYLAAPAAHLGCLWFARSRHGWPRGQFNAKRLLIICTVLYFAIGTARIFALGDPLALVTWPAHDLAGFYAPAAP